MTDKELAANLLKGSRFEKVRQLGEFINQNLQNDKQCYARLFHKGYTELNKEEIEDAIRILLNSKDRDLVIKSIKYVRKEYYFLIEEIIPSLKISDIFEILRTIDSDRLRLFIFNKFLNINEEIVIEVIKRMKDKSLLPDFIKKRYSRYMNEYISTNPTVEGVLL